MTTAVPLSIVVLLFAASAAQAPQAPPRDAPRPGGGLASVSGRVTDRETGEPIRRIKVELSRGGLADEPRVFEGVTDADGRYEIADVPAGEYFAMASVDAYGAGYLPGSFGAAEGSASSTRPAVTLRPGERRRDVDFALARSYAIEGRVTNEAGDPLADVAVVAERVGSGPGFFTGRPMTTDDRGQFRLWGFPPGSWRVCAKTSNRDAAAGGDTGQRYVRTCHPVADGKSGAIEIRRADVSGLVIQMQRERAYTLSGAVVDETGAPVVANVTVEVQRVEQDTFQWGPTYADVSRGSFVARGLTPGDYVVRTFVREQPSEGARVFEGPRLAGVEPVRMDASDVRGFVVVATRGVTVRGRVVFDGEPKPDLGLGQLRVTANRDGGTGDVWRHVNTPQPARIAGDLTFELAGIHGPVVLDVMNRPPGWLRKSVRRAGADITGTAIDFGRGGAAEDVEIVLTNRIARVTLRAIDESGAPARALVFVLPADPARRRLGASVPLPVGAEGRSPEVLMLPGDYIVLALAPEPSAVSAVMRNAESANEAAARGQRITVKEGDAVAVDVRVQKAPQ